MSEATIRNYSKDNLVSEKTRNPASICTADDDEVINRFTKKSQYNPVKILIMDDDIMVRLVMERLLERYGCEVVCTKNGEETIDVYKNSFEENPFSIVLMDLTIGYGLGGIETVKLLKEFDPKAKAIVFSGHILDPINNDFKKHGFDAILSKPMTNRELLSSLLTLLDDTENKS